MSVKSKFCMLSPVLSVDIIKGITSSANLVPLVSHSVAATASQLYSQNAQEWDKLLI